MKRFGLFKVALLLSYLLCINGEDVETLWQKEGRISLTSNIAIAAKDFPHSRQLLVALQDSQPEFIVTGDRDTVRYTFAQGKKIVNLDNLPEHVISPKEVKVCGAESQVQSADFLIATAGNVLSLSTRVRAHVIDSASQCILFDTEEISPLDLFESVFVEETLPIDLGQKRTKSAAGSPMVNMGPSPSPPPSLMQQNMEAEKAFQNCVSRVPYSDMCAAAGTSCLDQCFDATLFNWGPGSSWGSNVGSVDGKFSSCFDVWEFSLDANRGCSHRILRPLSDWGQYCGGAMQKPAYQTFGPNCAPSTQISLTGACAKVQAPNIPFTKVPAGLPGFPAGLPGLPAVLAGLPGISCVNCWISLMKMTFIVAINYRKTATGKKEFSYAIKLVGPLSASLGFKAQFGLGKNNGQDYVTQLLTGLPVALNQFRTNPDGACGNSQTLFPGLTYKADLVSFTATLSWVGEAKPLEASLTTFSRSVGIFVSNFAPFSYQMDPLETTYTSSITDTSGLLKSLSFTLDAQISLELTLKNEVLSELDFQNFGLVEVSASMTYGTTRRLDSEDPHDEQRELGTSPRKINIDICGDKFLQTKPPTKKGKCK